MAVPPVLAMCNRPRRSSEDGDGAANAFAGAAAASLLVLRTAVPLPFSSTDASGASSGPSRQRPSSDRKTSAAALRQSGEGAGARPCDHLLFYENLSIGLPPLLRAYGHSGNVSLPHANQLLARSSAEVCPGLNVSSLDVESRVLLRKAYARDFERFGYG